VLIDALAGDRPAINKALSKLGNEYFLELSIVVSVGQVISQEKAGVLLRKQIH
jgi:hypothetical protein